MKKRKRQSKEELRRAILEADLGEELARVTAGCCCCCCCCCCGDVEEVPESGGGGGEPCGGTCVYGCTMGNSAGIA